MHHKLFHKKKNLPLLKAYRCGIERESLRIDTYGKLSKTPHPKDLGAPLTHPYISTDFSEQQIEWNTPPLKSFRTAKHFLKEIIQFSLKNMNGELLWPFSMPPHLDHFEIAHYGTSHEGKRKKVYREGLKKRYGMNLQMISGIHFNFSFDQKFWKKLHTYDHSPLPLQEYINEKYLGIIRNFLREGWLLTYLFGSSPAMDPSYSPLPKNFKKESDFYYSPHATSLRTSHLGYYSRVQNQLAISFNDLDTYLSEMKKALLTPKKEYSTISTQLNDHILQTENEHYARIRPKRSPHKGESPLEALEKRGVEYLEIRAIDLDPYHAIGMNSDHIHFLHLFLLYCLFKKSPKLTKEGQRCLTRNQNNVALNGRDPNLILTCPRNISLKNWAKKILKELEPLSGLLGYEKTLALQKEKVKNPNTSPSALILNDIKNHGFQELGLSLAKLHQKAFYEKKISLKKYQSFEALAKNSHIQNQRLETASKILVEGYENFELSTQILIREAQKRGVKIEVLDKEDQVLRFSRGRHIEYIKEATKTSKDSYITPHLLENKEVTKKILYQKGFNVPIGKAYSTIESALTDYSIYQKQKVVVKPKATNFGLGIYFIHPGKKKEYASAAQSAFSYGNSIIVEKFCPGEEFRFLVIDGKVIGVAKREPANVVGDGKQSIKELIHEKNYDPSYYRTPKTFIHLGPEEKKVLHAQSLAGSNIPKKGKKIYLRHNSNISTGGDALDMTDLVHKGYHKIAVKATRVFNAKICGVDMIIPFPKQEPNRRNYAIIELNYNPVLFIHDYPYRGKRRDVAGPLLDLLGYSK